MIPSKHHRLLHLFGAHNIWTSLSLWEIHSPLFSKCWTEMWGLSREKKWKSKYETVKCLFFQFYWNSRIRTLLKGSFVHIFQQKRHYCFKDPREPMQAGNFKSAMRMIVPSIVSNANGASEQDPAGNPYLPLSSVFRTL